MLGGVVRHGAPGTAHRLTTNGIGPLMWVARKSPHRIPATTPESASPPGEDEDRNGGSAHHELIGPLMWVARKTGGSETPPLRKKGRGRRDVVRHGAPGTAHRLTTNGLGPWCVLRGGPLTGFGRGRPNPSAGSGQALPFPQERVMTRTPGRFSMSGG